MPRFTPLVRIRSIVVRLLLGATLATGLAISTIHAQIPGRNVNMVSGVRMPEGDPFLQRQNEPSIAASTRNPLHLLGGSNDYRTVDLPGLPNDEETGDAWLGLYKSSDGGQRWTSGLLPGYPQEKDDEGRDVRGLKSPLKTGAYQAAADAVVRAGTNGLFYYSGLAFNRGENGKSAIFLSRFIDNNNREDRDATIYLGTSLIATSTGTDGRFLDKPWMAVDIPRGGNPGTCRIETPGERHVSPQGVVTQELPVVQRIPAGTVYVGYTVFTGPAADRRADVFLTRSFDCGVTWQAPMQVSRPEDPLNQGAAISVDPRNGHIYVAWRRFSKAGTATTTASLDGVMLAKLPSGGRKFNPPGTARRFPKGQKKGLQPERFGKEHEGTEVEEPNEFDQSTSGYQFRTNAYPTMTVDGDGRVYLAWSERGFAKYRTSPIDGDARIVMVTTTDGTTFTAPQAVDNDPSVTGAATSNVLVGHQVMPSLTFAGGKLMLIYYDLRETKAAKKLGDTVFGPRITDANLSVRNTIDIRASMGAPGDIPRFAPSVKVSEYKMGFRDRNSPEREQLQYNPPNLPMFKQGTVPFMGDYIDVASGAAFVSTGKGKWAFNTAAGPSLPIFHAVWTDNRDVRAPANGDWTRYAPPTNTQYSAQQCIAGNAGSRNQNIYTSRITGGLLVGSPGNAKPLSPTVQRGFVVFAQNATMQTRTFRMTIVSQPPGGRASFDQFPQPPFTAGSPAPRTVIDLAVPPRSTSARTVYATATDPRAQIDVTVAEIGAVGGAVVLGGLQDRVVLNPDIENPDIENPDIETPDIENPDIENAEVYNPDIENPDIENPDIENPDIENPDIENPDIENPDLENPDIENITVANPDIENPDIENPDIENPDIENPDIENPDIENVAVGGDGVLTDITWNVTNTGNTTSAFNVNLFLAQSNLPAGLKTQLILHKSYRTPVVKPNDCSLAYETRNVVVANIPRPEFVRPSDGGVPDQNDPSAKNATLWLGPGEIGKITLRVYDADRSNNVPVTDKNGKVSYVDPALNPTTAVTPAVSSQAVDTTQTGTRTEPPLVTPTGANLFFLQSPTNALAGAAIAPAVSVQVRDNLSGLLVPGAPVTLSLATNPTGAILSGGNAVSNAAGIATFPSLSVSLAGTGYTLVASATTAGITASAVSTPFDVVAPLVVTTTSIPDGIAGLVYLQTLQSIGGVGTTRTWSLTGGTLPPGLTLEAMTGKITGTLASATRGSFGFTVQVADNAAPQHADTQSLSLLVTAQADLAVTVTDAPDPANVGQAVTYTIETTNTGPSTATNVSVVDSIPASAIFVSASAGCSAPTSGQLHCSVAALAPGATASVTVVLRPTSPGSLSNQVSAAALEADPISANNAATASTWVQSPVNIGVPSQSERTAQTGVPFALSLTASGGMPPYSWSLVGGALAQGLSLNAVTGVISGTATTIGACTFTVRAVDALGAFGTRTLCVNVVTPPATSLAAKAVGDGGGPTVTDLVHSLLGDGVAVSNVVLKGAAAGAGVFEGGSTTVGFERGIILSSGRVNDARGDGPLGQNLSDITTTIHGTDGDPDLTALAGQQTHDATVIEFDFVPTGTQVSFRYVFGSEEYNEFVASAYNDAFGFFIRHPGETEYRNWALVPGTNLPVAINTISGGNPFGGGNSSHPELYRNNDPNDGGATINIEADGLTVVLTLTATVTPGASHHMKLAIADALDSDYDSWVFIEGGSFHAVENCTNGIDDDGDGLVDAADPDCQVCPDPNTVIVTVPGTSGGLANVNSPGTGTAPVAAFTLAPGQVVTASATGMVTWFNGPNTSDPNGGLIGTHGQFLDQTLPGISLVARINGGPWQFVGTGPTILGGPGLSGVIEFAVNDSDYSDNGGSFTVAIQP